MFDFNPKVPEFGGLARLGELIQQGEISDLPAPLSLNGNLPARAKMGIIVHNLEDATMHVLKILHFTEKFAVTSGLEIYIPVFRQGPWSLPEGHSAPAGAYTRISPSLESRGSEATAHSEELILTMDSRCRDAEGWDRLHQRPRSRGRRAERTNVLDSLRDL